MKILDLYKLFDANAPMKKQNVNQLSFTTSRGLLFLVGKIAHVLFKG